MRKESDDNMNCFVLSAYTTVIKNKVVDSDSVEGAYGPP